MQQSFLSLVFISVFFVLMGLYHAFMLRSSKQAMAGKGWMCRLGQRAVYRRWRAALRPSERVQLTSIGRLDGSNLSDPLPVFAHNPVYQLALTDFGRVLIAPWYNYPLGGTVRKFRAYDWDTVSMDEVFMEVPDPQYLATPSYLRFGPRLKTFAVTLILPGSRLRLTGVDSRLVEALSR